MKKLEKELDVLREKITDMGNLSERMVVQAVDMLSCNDWSALIDEIMNEEDRLDLMQLAIDKEVIRLLTVYSPVAGDLRMVMSVSRIAAELERMGDHAVNMCESLQLLLAKAELELLPDLHRMAEVVRTMVSDSLNAFVQHDIEKAQATISNDNLVDVLNDQILEELLNLQSVREALDAKRDIAGAVAQLLIARSLERIADQSTNISEEVVYMVKGRDIRHQSRIGSDK